MAAPYFTFDIAAFRVSYPAFSSNTTYPDIKLQGYFDAAGSYIANENYGWLKDGARYLALTLMTAHLAALFDLIAAGETPGMTQAAGIDKVSVTLTPPPVDSQFKWWLSLTGYGQQLLALLSTHSAGGFYAGGSNTRGGFRGNSGFYRC